MSNPHEKLPDGVKHLHGALYLVKFDLLKIADPENIDGEKKEYEFRNPRTLTEKGQQSIFDKRKAHEMRESIKEKTLMNPFVCRWKTEDKALSIQMVGGERRHRAISWLRSKRELVKDPSTARLNDNLEYEYDFHPADKVYEYVLCQVYSVNNDIDALSLSYTENDCRINQGEGSDVAMVVELRRCGASDETIMAAMSKDEKWLCDTDTIISGLSENALSDLLEDRIEREAALELVSFKEKYGEEVVEKALIIAHEVSQKDFKKRFDQLSANVESAMTDKELAEAAVVEAEFQGEDVTSAQAAVVESDAKVQRTVKERNQDKPRTGASHVRGGVRAVTGGKGGLATAPAPRSLVLRGPKIKEFYVDPLEDLIKKGGKSVELDGDANVDALNLAIKLVRGILGGDTEAMDIIRLHYKKKTIVAIKEDVKDIKEDIKEDESLLSFTPPDDA